MFSQSYKYILPQICEKLLFRKKILIRTPMKIYNKIKKSVRAEDEKES